MLNRLRAPCRHCRTGCVLAHRNVRHDFVCHRRGVMVFLKTERQVAADSAATAAAAIRGDEIADPVDTVQEFTIYYKAAGKSVNFTTSDVEHGTWDSDAKTLTRPERSETRFA
jgi:hypothetical protein